MIVILNSKTHVGTNPPSDTTKTWISADMTEISIYPEPETYGRLNERIDVKAILLEHNLDIKSNRIRVFSLADDVLEVKRYVNGEWVVIDNPDNYVDIIMNGKVIGVMEVDSIAPGEQVEEWDGSGVVIEEIATESIIGTWVFNEEFPVAIDKVSYADRFTYAVNFVSNGVSYTSIMIYYDDDVWFGYGMRYDNYPVFEDGWWGDEYRTITITSESTDSKFIAWLKANAVKQ